MTDRKSATDPTSSADYFDADPRTDLENLVKAFAPASPLKVLELGCGKGRNAKFFFKRGDYYFGMDRYLRVPLNFRQFGIFLEGDFSEALPHGFDLICDRAGFVYNSTDALRRTLALAHESLKVGGLLIAADLYAEGHPQAGVSVEWREGGAADPIRTFTRAELEELFAAFETLHLEKRTDEPTFDFVGRKRE